MKYLKRPIPIHVTFARRRDVLQTREGTVQYEPGDAIATGVEGEQWPIARAVFEATYRALPPTQQGQDGPYVKAPIPVDAQQVFTAGAVPLANGRGRLQAQAGDWILSDGDGNRWVVGDTIFRATYEPIDFGSVPTP